VNKKQKTIILLWCALTSFDGYRTYQWFNTLSDFKGDFFKAGLILWVTATLVAAGLFWVCSSSSEKN